MRGVLSVGLWLWAMPSLACQMMVLVQQVDGVTGTPPCEVTILSMETVPKVINQWNQQMPQEQESARQWIAERLQALKTDLQRAYLPVLLAAQYKITAFPAVIVDNTVIYTGTKDLDHVYTLYQDSQR